MSQHENLYVKFENEPEVRWYLEDFNELLCWAVDNQMSDLILSSNEPVWLSRLGCKVPVTNRKLLTDEINDLIDDISKSNSVSSDLQSGHEKNFSYAIKKRSGHDISFSRKCHFNTAQWSSWLCCYYALYPSISSIVGKFEH